MPKEASAIIKQVVKLFFPRAADGLYDTAKGQMGLVDTRFKSAVLFIIKRELGKLSKAKIIPIVIEADVTKNLFK